MKKLTVNTIKGLNFGQKSKLAHAIAKTTILEGCYALKLSFAWRCIKNNSVNQINGLLFPNPENIAKAVMEYRKENNISIESLKEDKKAPRKKKEEEPKKAPSKKAPKKKAPKKKKEEKENINDIVSISIEQLENETKTLNILDNSDITFTIQQLLLGYAYETKNLEMKEVKGLIYRKNIKTYNQTDVKKSPNQNLQEYRQNILTCIDELNQAKTEKEVQGHVMAIMYVDSNWMAYNILSKGYDSKKAITEDMNYYVKNGVAIEQTLLKKYEPKDLVHTMTVDSYKLDFKMFHSDNPRFILSAIKMRLKNALRVLDKGQMKVDGESKKVKMQPIDVQTSEGETVNLLDTLGNLTRYDNKFNEVLYDRYIDTKHSLKEIFTKRELKLITLLTEGYDKKEIALNDGKSPNYYNRDYAEIKRKGKKFKKELLG